MFTFFYKVSPDLSFHVSAHIFSQIEALPSFNVFILLTKIIWVDIRTEKVRFFNRTHIDLRVCFEVVI